jgi:hypothetical protein
MTLSVIDLNRGTHRQTDRGHLGRQTDKQAHIRQRNKEKVERKMSGQTDRGHLGRQTER